MNKRRNGQLSATMQGMGVDDLENGRAVLAEAMSAFRKSLDRRLMAAYALGSLAHGGFSSLVSDVDLGLVLADPPLPSDPETIAGIAEAVKAGGSVLHQRLSVFWGTRSTLLGEQAGGRFPPFDVLDLIQHGLLLTGEDARQGLPQPSHSDLVVAGAEFALDSLAGIRFGTDLTGHLIGSNRPADPDAVEQLHRPEILLALGVRRVTKLVLFPIRFLYTAQTGLVGTNQSAAEHYLAADRVPGTNLVAAALAWRNAPPDSVEEKTLLESEIIPLYLHYIDDHIPRLIDLRRLDLAEAFVEWRRRIGS
jgi:hypothetical protein